MSTQQVLGVVGGVVGAFFGYPQLGFVVGSLVGGLLTPAEKTQGPRVDDLKVQVSTYGAGVPILYGTERIGGNVVWSTDKIETETTTGGKGGAPEHTTYRYFVHMGIVLCETPRDGAEVSIVQIFQDGKLIYDARSGIPIASALASAENPYAFFNLYQGHADQLPDAIEELYAGGPGSVPAYRGVVRIRMNAVECPGGRVPQFSFVLSNRSTKADEQQAGTFFPIPTPVNSSQTYSRVPTNGDPVIVFNDGAGTQSGWTTTYHVFTLYALGLDYCNVIGAVAPYDYATNYLAIKGSADIDAVCLRQVLASTFVDQGYNTVFTKDGESKTFATGSDVKAYGQSTSRWVKRGDLIAFSGDSLQGDGIGIFNWGSMQPRAIAPSVKSATLNLTSTHLWTTVETAGVRTFSVRSIDDLTEVASGPCPAAISSTSVSVYITTSVDDTILIVYKTSGSTVILEATISSLSIITVAMKRTIPFVIDGPTAVGNTSVEINAGAMGGVVRDSSTTDWRVSTVLFDRVTLDLATAVDVIADQCDRAGETRYDVSEIPTSDTVTGYKIQNPASARANIDPLLTAFAIYIVDEDGLIKFKKYEDITSEAAIAYDELGQAEDGSVAPDAMPLNRAQEVDLPRSVSVSYIEPAIDYQTASEKEVRQITESNEDAIIELPMATTSDHAKQVASMILFARWRAQNTRSFKTSRKYAFLSAGDGVTVEYPRGTFRLWRITSMTDTGALCEINVEPGDANLYTQTAVGATGYVQQAVIPLPPQTRMEVIDSAILRDADNDAGPYVALAGFADGWTGAELRVGEDLSNASSRGAVVNEAVMGFAESTLGTWSANVVDETNLVTVNVGRFVLNSITRDVLLTGASNVAAIGANGRWEIIKFQRADSLGNGRYTLSGLLRGTRGTEWAAGLHQFGDKFVLLSVAGMLRPTTSVGEIGLSKVYEAITKGRSSSSATVQNFANTGEGLRPFSPTNLRKSVTSNNITLTWDRRTRLSENWMLGLVPLGETSEHYQVAIYSDNTYTTVKRVIDAYARTATYTSADQLTDFGSNQSTIYVKVFQMSDSIGRGRELQASI